MEVIPTKKVNEFICLLNTPADRRTRKMIDMLSLYGNELRMPYSKSLGKGLFELRILGNIQVRINECRLAPIITYMLY